MDVAQASEPTDTEKALLYYRCGVEGREPPFIPARVRLKQRVRGDLIFAHATVDAGEYDCESNRYGAVSVRADDGKMLGLRPTEFDVLAWRASPFFRA